MATRGRKKPARKAAARRKSATAAKAASKLVARPVAQRRAPQAKPAPVLDGWRRPCSDAAVQKGTGRRWQDWIDVINAGGGAGRSHREIAEWLHRRHRVGGWWAQMVTVGYERATGRRVVGQKAGGHAASASLTVDAAPGRVFDAWDQPAERRRWLAEDVTVHKSTRPKSLRITDAKGRKGISVNLTGAGTGRTRVQVQHEGLATAAAADQRRKSWKAALAALAAHLAAG